MIARKQTDSMLSWWKEAGISDADLAVRRLDGAMIWHRDVAINRLPLSWARAMNVRGCEIYVRPAGSHAWPLVSLDDVPVTMARRIARKYRALVIVTSSVGGCHLWLSCSQRLSVPERAAAQRWLAAHCGADRASTSGEHLGRLAGFKNWKRGGCWVNRIGECSGRLSWDFSGVLQIGDLRHTREEITRRVMARTEPEEMTQSVITHTGSDRSESGREWGWVCGRLEIGDDPSRVLTHLCEHARARRGSDVDRYARRTVFQALRRVAAKANPAPSALIPKEESTRDTQKTA